jgi:LDH2 family malate/lactate/ureidoglycolate dehydrogenase
MRGDPVPEQGKNYGFFLMALDPEIFGAKKDFLAGVHSLVEQIKNADRPTGFRRYWCPENAPSENVKCVYPKASPWMTI